MLWLWRTRSPARGKLPALLDHEPHLARSPAGLPVIADKRFAFKEFEADLTSRGGGRTVEGVAVRVAQRILVLAAAIRRDHNTGAQPPRSATGFDH